MAITIVPKRAVVPGRTSGLEEYTPAERRSIDRAIAQSEKEYREGKGAGPFDTAGEFAASMEADIRKLRMARRIAGGQGPNSGITASTIDPAN